MELAHFLNIFTSVYIVLNYWFCHKTCIQLMQYNKHIFDTLLEDVYLVTCS